MQAQTDGQETEGSSPQTEFSQFATQTHLLEGSLHLQEKELSSAVANIQDSDFSRPPLREPAAQDGFVATDQCS